MRKKNKKIFKLVKEYERKKLTLKSSQIKMADLENTEEDS